MDSKKIRTGISAADIVALVFVILGAVFCAVGACVTLAPGVPHGRGTDAAVLSLVFGAIGAPFLAVGLVLAVLSARKRAMMRRVVSEGYYVMADVADVRPNFGVQVNGRCPYVLECHYRDPATGALHVFRSRNLFFYPAELENRRIRVYTDRNNLNRYYLDVESLLPDVEIH